ncbi:F-box associated interaction domain-containing protein [Artemisia annua]|uniref:F-box associated interaction domain-containing protein n=1 Tax=Artemisia annua TaxID=35608 RepID=A0A2U1LZ68_ARTAN|nr:F-box associated interaction domain-containing protein [Artemisia annua]
MAADSRSLIAPSKRNRYLMEFPDLDAILATLPLNTLFFCCTVSKSLSNRIMKDSGFANLHFVRSEPQLLIHCPTRLSYHLIDLNAGTNFAFGKRIKVKPSFNFPLRDFRVTHSSNGLVLMENSDFYDLVHQCIVLNSVTGEYTMLPQSTFLSKNVRSAFFYCPITNNFKVFLAFDRLVRSSPILESSLNSNSDSMGPKFPKCQKIAKKIGSRRIDKILQEIFRREKEAYDSDEKDYNQRIEELEARVDYRRGIIVELENHGFDSIMDEPLAILKAAVQDDLAEIERLTQMSHVPVLRDTEKSKMVKKIKIIK